MIADYTGLNFNEIQDLNIVDYLIYKHDAFIYNLEQTDKGKEYLDNAWRLQQTEPDRQALRKKFK